MKFFDAAGGRIDVQAEIEDGAVRVRVRDRRPVPATTVAPVTAPASATTVAPRSDDDRGRGQGRGGWRRRPVRPVRRRPPPRRRHPAVTTTADTAVGAMTPPDPRTTPVAGPAAAQVMGVLTTDPRFVGGRPTFPSGRPPTGTVPPPIGSVPRRPGGPTATTTPSGPPLRVGARTVRSLRGRPARRRRRTARVTRRCAGAPPGPGPERPDRTMDTSAAVALPEYTGSRTTPSEAGNRARASTMSGGRACRSPDPGSSVS